LRVLIASLPIGTGHDSAARAITEALTARGASVWYSRDLDPFAAQARAWYYRAIRWLPGPYDYAFGRADHAWTAAWSANRRHWQRFSPHLARLADTYRPDWVVATHPFALTAWAGVTRRRYRLAGVITDLSAHRFWYEPAADAYAVWLPEMWTDLARWGFDDPGRVWLTGIPIRPEFAGVRARPDGPVVVMGGGLGLGPIERTVERLIDLGRPLRIICGRNERLFRRLRSRFQGCQTRVYGYVDNVPELLDGAALMVSKPGGVTVAETAAVGLPLLLAHHLPGQERRNGERLVSLGAAVSGEANLVPSARALLGRPRWDEQVRRQRLLARPDAAQTVAMRLYEASLMPVGRDAPAELVMPGR
jgi:processive 1,2-diacylglycerol beta-glucosyltransferase